MKKSSKKRNKKNTSEMINKIIPNFIFLKTFLEWNPWKVLSRITSRHHWNIIINIINIPNKFNLIIFELNIFTVPVNKIIIPNALIKGHGL